MDIRDEIAASKGKSNVDSSFTQVDDADYDVSKRSVGKRKRSVDEVVSDDLNVASKEGEDDEVGSDENIASDERDDGDNKVGSVKKGNIMGDGDSDEEDKEYEDKESEEEMESKEERKTTKGKKKDVASESNSESEDERAKKRSKKMKKVLKVKKNSKKKQVSDSSSSFEEEKPLKKKKKQAKKEKDAKKKKKKPLTHAQIKKEKYLSGFPILRSRTVPCSLFAAIHDSQVDMKSFLLDVRFSSFHFVFIDTLPSRLASPRDFRSSSCGTSIFDLPERPLDDEFVMMWFKQFNPNPLKDIHANDIAEKLVLAKKVDFMFKVNFLMLFANVMGIADIMKVIVNLTCSPEYYSWLLHWSVDLLDSPEEVIGKLELHGSWRESELHETEGFYEVGDNDIVFLEEEQVHVDDVHPGDGENVETNVVGEEQTTIEAKDVVEDAVNEAKKE
ncbi:hypothetical protein Tco_0578553 [Tanacetum coccineum]